MNANIEGLYAFARIAEYGSFQRAAEALCLSPSAVSRRISSLESQLGVRLLDRTTRTVKLTAVGSEFLPRALRLVDELESSFENLRDVGKRGYGDVTFACVPTVAIQLLPPVLIDYSTRHPCNRIRIVDVRASEVLHAVMRGEAEFGITGNPVAEAERPHLTSDALFEEVFVLACHVDHPLAKRKTIRWADLARHKVIGAGRMSGNRVPIDFGFPRTMPQHHWTYEVQHSTWTGLGMAEAGVGVVAVPAMALWGERHPKLVSRPLVEPQISRTIAVIRRRDTTLSPAALELLRLLKRRWKKHSYLPTVLRKK